ncbi:MAG: hypothetical protein II707_07165, partial [Spirochaetales bacterium]|nr:hypothetical protein [Spirochaetales bacterium]
MSKSIPQIPEIPVEIKDARNKDKLAIFIGAGVSRLLGCKDWHSLALDLLKQCYNYKYINYREYNQLSKYTDNKKIISIAYGLLKDKYKKLFFQTMKESLSLDDNDCKIYDYIYRIGSLFVTTNADEI